MRRTSNVVHCVTAEQKSLKHQEIELFYRIKALMRKEREPLRLPSLRCLDIEAIFSDRYGRVLPNDDAGWDDARIMTHHIAGCVVRDGRSAEYRITNWLRLRCPWMAAEDIAHLVMETQRWPCRWSAAKLGEVMNLTYADRMRLRITTIRAVDCSGPEQERRRQERRTAMRRAKRRSEGVRNREQYEGWSLSRTKPWEKLGISRRTWERRRDASLAPAKKERENGGATLASTGDGGVRPVSPGGGQEGRGPSNGEGDGPAIVSWQLARGGCRCACHHPARHPHAGEAHPDAG